MKPKNHLFLISDEHSRRVLGCYGDTIVKTPNLDKLAASGTRFTNAYTPSPICVPARASLATGRYLHQHRNWSCAEPYSGTLPSWSHRLRDEGHRCTSIGKLHFRSTEDDNGFEEEILPQHCINGQGWIKGLVRDHPMPDYDEGTKAFSEALGKGESAYTSHDRQVADAACDWLRKTAANNQGKPWVLFVSFISPHYPLISPPEFFNLYDPEKMPVPHRADESPTHPALKELYDFFNYKDYMIGDKIGQATAAYYGLCSYVDHMVGEIVDVMTELGLNDDTRISYTSDHGEMLGNHGMWTKQVMYEDAVGIPLIIAGPDIPAGKVVDTQVSLIDFYPTILEGVGISLNETERSLSGENLFDLANHEVPDRVVVSEYHDGGVTRGFFMLRYRQWKLVYYVGHEPQLFDLENDPMEDEDLAHSSSHRHILKDCKAKLYEILDPEVVDENARSDQAEVIARLGGRDAILNMEGMNFFVQGV
ncbi:MAG: sulfatase-like hydrolase/transferase [Anaerolineae bacterium]